MKKPLEKSAIKNKALYLLGRREHSYLELAKKLHQRGAQYEDIHPILDDLVSQGLLSNERFLEAFVHAKMGAGYGPHRIMCELNLRGFSRAEVKTVFSSLHLDWDLCLYKTWQKKFSVVPKTMPDKAKQIRYLMNRGFEEGKIKSLLSANGDVT